MDIVQRDLGSKAVNSMSQITEISNEVCHLHSSDDPQKIFLKFGYI